MFAGESLFMATYTAEQAGPGLHLHQLLQVRFFR